MSTVCACILHEMMIVSEYFYLQSLDADDGEDDEDADDDDLGAGCPH